MSDLDVRVAAVASRQHATFTHAQALACGATPSAIKHRIRAGRWLRVHRGVYRIAGVPLTWEGKVMADVLAGGDRALASHRTAAVLWDLDGFRPGPPEVSVVRHRKPEQLSLRVHESTDLHLARPACRRGIPVTGLLRTLVDIGRLVTYEQLDCAVEEVVRRGRYDWPDLYHCLVAHARRGRNGVGPLRAVLEERYGDKVTDSRWETMVVRLLVDAGVDEPVTQHPIFDGDRFVAEVDLAWPSVRVGVELQSKKHHLTPTRFERDLRRLTEARLLGWSIPEYTWKFFIERPHKLVAEVRQVLDLARSRSA
jgi:hypothetical protein